MSIAKGKRVEIPAYTDQWMRGDRFGEVIGNDRIFLGDRHLDRVTVLLDKSRKPHRFEADDCREID